MEKGLKNLGKSFYAGVCICLALWPLLLLKNDAAIYYLLVQLAILGFSTVRRNKVLFYVLLTVSAVAGVITKVFFVK